MESYNQILEEKIKFGKVQFIYIASLALVDFNDGLEIVLMSISLPLVRDDFQINTFQVSYL